ncbi:YggS family pyridoxal phosphate-dependent enzyme [Bacteroidota bacterium]
MNIKINIENIIKQLPINVKLVAISKTKPVEVIQNAYEAGHRIFGENKVQELIDKHEKLPEDIEWHMVGHLQTNKVKYIAPFISLIHSVDSFKLLKTINKEAIKENRIIKCLLQMHIAEEETKYGLSKEEIIEILDSDEYEGLKNIKVIGLMGMATFTDDEDQIRKEFRELYLTFKELKSTFYSQIDTFKEISMGMSGDYKIALEEGSTMIRLGSIIFGERIYIH